ncbi:MAG: CDP-alcohol phosphatidyltransferase family protein [Rhizobiales bacterium]|nr:CDP-alcohol phosphatidyltransferase family protein [Hyphomicrobiales bacterium]
MTDPASPRRPLASRDTTLARRLTQALLATSVTPNQISLLSIVFAAAGAAALLAAPQRPWAWLAAALAIQLRLLCNLLDGMVAVEGGRGSTLGALYNEIPDRIADSILIVALGHAAGAPWLGWAGALAAALTAYVRTLGGSLGLPQDFRGPMAKPQRMATMTLACVLAPLEFWLAGSALAPWLAAWAIALGSVLTCGTRLAAIARALRERAP